MHKYKLSNVLGYEGKKQGGMIHHSLRTFTFSGVQEVAETSPDDRASRIDFIFAVEVKTSASNVLFVDARAFPTRPAVAAQKSSECFIPVDVETVLKETPILESQTDGQRQYLDTDDLL